MRGTVEVAHGQGGADLRAGNTVAVFIDDIGDDFHFEAVTSAGAAQVFDIAKPFMAVAEIFAHQEPACVQTLN